MTKNKELITKEYWDRTAQITRSIAFGGNTPPVSERNLEWQTFSTIVSDHIEQYTVPQYGDKPHDQLHTDFTPGDCMKSIKRYCNRAGQGQRGREEELRDLLKIAHYACVAYAKRMEAANDAQKER